MNITIATSIKYGNYQAHQPNANLIVRLLKKHWNHLQRTIDFDPSVKIVIRPIKGVWAGMAYREENRIELDPRYSLKVIMETIAHELKHNEQYKHGRLTSKVTNGKMVRVWNGSEFPKTAYNPKTYKFQPWEVEACAAGTEFGEYAMIAYNEEQMRLRQEAEQLVGTKRLVLRARG